MKPTVSLVKYANSPDSLKNAVELADGFSGLNKNGKIVIKPNLVAWDTLFKIAPYGVFTTTRLVEDIIILLKDYGCTDISVGEGSVEVQKGVGTKAAFTGLGYDELSKKYGIKLIDFNESEAAVYDVHDGFKLSIAKEAVEAEHLINFPVLKTHGQTKVSLGMKNLKGCLKLVSKKFCHNTDLNLEYCFSFIADYVKPYLTIVDGIYALEKGALHFGNAFRKDIIVASKSPLGADMVAAKTIGYSAEDIDHLKEFASRHGIPLDLTQFEIKGEPLEDNIKPLKWDWSWTEGNTGPAIFQKFGITGAAVPKYDETLCSGCSPVANMVNILVLSAFKGKPLASVEILNGKKMQARSGYEKTVLLGNCIIKANEDNKNIAQAIKVKGCPPKPEDLSAALREAGLEINEMAYIGYLKQQSEKYNGKEGYDPELFSV